MVARVEITEKAAEIVARLKLQHGALMFHQSGGCCDGSAPMCYPQSATSGSARRTCCSVRSRAARSIWVPRNSTIGGTRSFIIDVVPGRGSGFSAEAPEGVRFLTRSRLFTDEEAAELDAAGLPAPAA